MNFEDFNLSKELLEAIKKLGFSSPTQIQEKSIPLTLKGKDIIGESATGSGKTLVFGCGIIENIEPKNGLQALILTPTRELAEQVKDNLKQLSRNKHFNIMPIYGGVSINPQINDIKKADIVVATPGRLLDHLQRRTIDLSKIKILVLDEADRMFDMGFIGDVERIIQQCPKKRQTLFFSATITPNINHLAKKHMINPTIVLADNLIDPSKLKQVCYNLPHNMKLSLLIDLLKNEKSGLVMVFCNTRRSTEFVVKNLRIYKINAFSIHGGLTQSKRKKTIESFNSSKVDVLVCTDVASRGLHINNVSHIYNYEIPSNPKDYIHRIGRTARAGANGKVVNFLSPNDYNNFDNIQLTYKSFSIETIKKSDFKQIIPIKIRRPFNQASSNERGNFDRRNETRPYVKKRFIKRR